MEALNSESDSRVLGPQLVRELLYRALHDSGGDALCAANCWEAKLERKSIASCNACTFTMPNPWILRR